MIKRLLNYYYKKRKPVKFLKKNGAVIGNNLKITPPFNCSEAELVRIGDNCNFSFDVTFILHDGSNTVPEHLGLTAKGARKYGKIVIGNNVFIGAKSIIMPGVNIGNNVIIGAGSVVTKSIPPNSVAAGVPAKVIESLHDYIDKNISLFINRKDIGKIKEIVKEPE